MPIRSVDKISGAIKYRNTKEEKTLKQVMEENRILSATLANLLHRVEELENEKTGSTDK